MVLLIFLAAWFCLITAFVLFDRVLRFQFQNFPKEWEKQGKAIGFIWTPPNTSLFSGSLQRSVRWLSWTFGTEDWMTADPKIMKMVWMIRACVSAFWLLLIPFVYFGFVTR